MKKLSLLTLFILCSAKSFAFGHDFVTYPEPLRAPASLFEDKNKELKTLGNFQNKVVILNFWATWCKPCVVEMPSLLNLQKKYKGQGLQVIPLVAEQEDVSKVRAFYRRYKLSELDYFVDNTGFTANSYQVESIPTSFIFNRNGKLIAYASGSIDWMTKANQDFIEQLLSHQGNI